VIKARRALLWLRNDLRLHDHEILAVDRDCLLPVYCFDPRRYAQHALDFPKTGPFRAQFLLQTVADLRQSLQARGGDLLVAVGKPEDIIPPLARKIKAEAVFVEHEVTAEEHAVERRLEAALDISLQRYWGHSLLHPDDLPFAIDELPDVYTPFRRAVEKRTPIRAPYPTPATMPAFPDEVEPGPLPSLHDLGLTAPPADPRGVMTFHGGETAALARLEDYIWQRQCLAQYKETRNGLLGERYSSKFSPWLACGALSPRWIYHEVRRFEQEITANDSTYWLIFELLWRDYFRFVAMKYGNRIFHAGGLSNKTPRWKPDRTAFDAWRRGETNEPFIDANMRELACTGFMSNRGRQNVASFLCHDLRLDWRWGAAWFESCLIDYDVCSNQGNWLYLAGFGNDPRQGRKFNIRRQAERYDPDNRYVQHWLSSR